MMESAMDSLVSGQTASGPGTQVVTVTPAKAARWLGHNTHNRPLRERKVLAYARDMTAGNWVFNGDAIRFSVDGTLLDGQHRLAAIVQSGQTLPMLIVWGLAPETQESMDIGARRTFGDALNLRGEPNAAIVAAIARRALAFKRGAATTGGCSAPTHAEMTEYVVGHRYMQRAAEVGRVARSHVPVAPSVVGAAFLICAELHLPNAETFYVDQLIELNEVRNGDPARALLQRFQNEAANGRQMHPDDAFRYCVVAWNHFRAGRRITRLQAPAGGWPAGGPEPR